MAASTLPASFHTSYINPSTTSYDEFGAHDIPAIAPIATSWDEQVVPALRKKLEEESKRLDQRMGQAGQQQYRVIAKPARRLDRAHEVLQDGLGSDDLIPSGWATGSSAQFAAIAPRAKAQAEDRLRSTSAHQPYTSHDYSPPLHLESPPSAYLRHTPSPPGAGSSSNNIVQAREKARRLAREREMMGYTQQPSPIASQGEHFQSEWAGQTEAHDARKDGGEWDNQRARTVSSPALQKQPSSGVLPRSSNKGNLRDDASSRIPLPASKSMPKALDQDTTTHDVRKTRSTARLNATQPPHSQEASPQDASKARASPLRPLQNNAVPGHNESVLDEFGPLGGTPTPTKRGRWPGETNEEEAWRATQRSVSNPWDEEMIPTVKKRLEQQKMLDDLSRDEDFVDTWDRNGLPLSKRQVSLRQRASEGRGDNAVTPTSSPRKKEERSVDEGSEKMRQLHEQLDLGSLGQQQPSNDRQEERLQEQERRVDLHESQRRELLEMDEVREKESQQRQEEQEKQRQHREQHRHRQQAGFASRNGHASASEPRPTPSPSASKEQAAGPVLAEVDAAGCCKCTVM